MSGDAGNVLNFNLGILGHVDSGKTSLARALSTTASTAAFDKNPQSQERGITLDLGFSSFSIAVSDALKERSAQFSCYDKVQATLVDCPGHASLIRTVIGGAQIIDAVILVIDASKGIQTQTAECLILAEITCPTNMVIVLNKIDLVVDQSAVQKLEKRVRKAVEPTSFKDAPFVKLSACPGANPANSPQDLSELLSVLQQVLYVPQRSKDGPFLFLVDHCFAIKGQGTVTTGTVLSGSISVGASVQIPSLGEQKKVKSIQVFKKPVSVVVQGDRCGICLAQFDSSSFERGLISSAGAVLTAHAALVSVNRIPYFKPSLQNKSRFHVSVGHETVMARFSFFSSKQMIDLSQLNTFDFALDYDHVDELTAEAFNDKSMHYFALAQFAHPILCPSKCMYIVSRLDTDIHANSCRLAFHGKMLHTFIDKQYVQTHLPALKVFKWKSKQGLVERMTDQQTVIAHSLLKKQSDLELFAGLKVILSTGEEGYIESSFGQSGKIKIRIPNGLMDDTAQMLSALSVSKKKTKKPSTENQSIPAAAPTDSIKVSLTFKRFIYDPKKKMVQ